MLITPAQVYRAETALRDLLSRLARRLGWVPTVLAHPGYGSGGRVRVLGRVLLAPAGTRPEDRVSAGWERLFTLESPGAAVDIEVGGGHATVVADRDGLVDATLALPPTGDERATARMTVGNRSSSAPVYLTSPEAARGVVCDLDDTLLVTGIATPLRAAWRTFIQPARDRRAVPGMAELLRELTAGEAAVPVVYLSNGPWNFVGSLERFLARGGFPPGALLLTDWGVQPDRWFRDGKAHKREALRRLADDLPDVDWTLLGDTGEHDPELYAEFARARPGHVRAVLLRDVSGGPLHTSWLGPFPVVSGADGLVLRQAWRELPARTR